MLGYNARCSKNGVPLGVAYTLAPGLMRAAMYPSCSLKNAELVFNFGATPLKYPVPVRCTVSVMLDY